MDIKAYRHQEPQVAVEETSTDLAETASRKALGWTDGGYAERTIKPEDIDLIVFATVTLMFWFLLMRPFCVVA